MPTSDLFSEQTRLIINTALEFAREHKHRAVDVEHILLASLSNEKIREILSKLNVDWKALHEQVLLFLQSVRQTSEIIPDENCAIPLTNFLKQAIDSAGREAYLIGDVQILPEHLLLGILSTTKSAATFILNDFGVNWKIAADIVRLFDQRVEPISQQQASVISYPKSRKMDLIIQSKIRILFIGSNPVSTSRLRLDEEFRSIQQCIQQSEYRDNFEVNYCMAVRTIDLQSYLLRFKPNIVHFGGHGCKDSSIIVEDYAGNPHPISPKTMGKLFSLLIDNVVCVLLNACYSEQQADEISKYVKCVIGMSDSISDKAAISFATSFYQALGYGRDILSAFQLGCLQIELDGLCEEDVPKLFSNSTPSNIFFDSGS